MSDRDRIAGAILAGGQSRRMGENKAFLSLAGTPLIEHAIERLRPQVSQLILNAHEPGTALDAYGLPVVPDAAGDHQGPLAGILAALRWAETAGFHRVATVAVDTPFFPKDFVRRLAVAAQDKTLAVASSGGRMHPVFGLWGVTLMRELERQIGKGQRSVQEWVGLHDAGIVEWPMEPYDPFFNLNHPDDVTKAVRILAESAP